MLRSFLLPLAAVLVSPATGSAADAQFSAEKANAQKARLGLIHAIAGAGSVDMTADGKTLYRNIKYGLSKKPKLVNAEGYTVDVSAAKVGWPFLDNLTLSLQGGRDYTIIPYGDTSNSSPTLAAIVDIPGLLIPKTGAYLVFVNAVGDTDQKASLVVDDVPVLTDVAPGQFAGPFFIPADKHRVEVQVNGQTIVSTGVKKLKGGQSHTFVLMGTADPTDNKPLKLAVSSSKGR